MTEVILVDPMEDTALTAALRLKPPPLHLMYLAAALRERGHGVRILEDNLDAMGPEGTAKKVGKEDPSLVGITAATATVDQAFRYAEAIRRECPNVKIVLGGPHVTFVPAETLHSCGAADAVCIGEGEETLCEIASRVQRDGDLSDIRGIAYRKDGHVVINEPRELIKDIDHMPLPARDLVDVGRCVDPVTGKPIGNMITSRGCVFNCTYCASSRIMGRRFRARSPTSIVDEMEVLMQRYGVEFIEFLDDNFVLDRKRAIAVAHEIKHRGLDIQFVASSRVDTIDRELLRELKSAGLTSIYYGIESGSQRVLDLMNKGIKVEKAVDAVKAAKEADVKVVGSFILGYPGETLAEMDETIRHALSLDVDFAQFSLLTPYPGTPVWESLRGQGLLAECGYDSYTVLDPVINYEKMGVSTQAVRRKLLEAYVRFYLRPRFLIRNPSMITVIPRIIRQSLHSRRQSRKNGRDIHPAQTPVANKG